LIQWLVSLLPALAAGLLMLASHVPLGMEVLRRGIIFIDLAIAQIAGLGIVIASTLGFAVDGWRTQLSAVLAALAGALALRWMEKKNPAHLEAVIGVSFVAAACAAVVLMSQDPHAGEHLQELLVGQILWSTLMRQWRIPRRGLSVLHRSARRHPHVVDRRKEADIQAPRSDPVCLPTMRKPIKPV
jgi:zinc/manganese transport system permease protein